MAKRIVPIRATPTCVGTALTSSFSLVAHPMEVDQGVPSVAAGTQPQKGTGPTLQSERARASRLDDMYVRRYAGARRAVQLDSPGSRHQPRHPMRCQDPIVAGATRRREGL
jgi:hypothetical protein